MLVEFRGKKPRSHWILNWKFFSNWIIYSQLALFPIIFGMSRCRFCFLQRNWIFSHCVFGMFGYSAVCMEREEGVCKHMYVSVHQRFNFLGYISTYLGMLALFFRILLLDAFCVVAEWSFFHQNIRAQPKYIKLFVHETKKKLDKLFRMDFCACVCFAILLLWTVNLPP